MKNLIITILFMLPLAAFSQTKKDTLEIPKHIKYIQLDGKVFEIHKRVEIKEAEPRSIWESGWRGESVIIPNHQLYNIDTSFGMIQYPAKIKKRV